MENKIKLYNRYRSENQLIQSVKDTHKWYLVFNNPIEIDWCRILLKEGEHDFSKKDYFAIDPSGGPFISVGSEIEGYKVTKISRDERDEDEPVFQNNDLKFAYTIFLNKQ